jgi:hypothetical protein
MLALVCIAGCDKTAFSVTHQQWSDASVGSATRIQLGAEKCLIMTDLAKSEGGPFSFYRCSGSHRSADDERFSWEAETKDGRTFSAITIDGTRYDLSKGRLILVSRKSGKTIVRQLDRDPEKLRDLYREMERDRGIREFFDDPEAKK